MKDGIREEVRIVRLQVKGRRKIARAVIKI